MIAALIGMLFLAKNVRPELPPRSVWPYELPPSPKGKFKHSFPTWLLERSIVIADGGAR